MIDAENDESSRRAAESQPWAYAAWLLALVGSLASLFISEIMELRPCSLCWYQRVCLFPLVLVIGAGIARADRELAWYALPLALVGLAIATHHNLLQLGIIPETLAPCVEGESCSEKQIEWLGFVTIPLMALGSFLAISACLVQNHRRRHDAESGSESR
jgi:disulfide bond formation protein DsbB